MFILISMRLNGNPQIHFLTVPSQSTLLEKKNIFVQNKEDKDTNWTCHFRISVKTNI